MQLVASFLLLSSSAILLFYGTTSITTEKYPHPAISTPAAAEKHRGLLLLGGEEGGLLGFIIALFSIFTASGRRRFFSCQLGFNFCLCNFDDLRQAIEENTDADSSICFSTTILAEDVIDLSNKSFRIGCDGEPCGLRPSSSGRFFVGSPQNAIFDTLSFTDGYGNDGGGAMKLTGGVTTFINCEFFRNSASSNGGAIYISGGQLALDSPIFSDNTATGSGGGIYATGGATVSITGESDEDDILFDHFFNFNSADQGGAIAVDSAGTTITLQDTDFFCGNTADTSGDNVFIGSGATVTCDNVSFEADRGLAGDSSPTCLASPIIGDGSTTFCTTTR